MYAVEGGATLSSGATVGTTVRVNTINQVGSSHKVYLNGSLKKTDLQPERQLLRQVRQLPDLQRRGPDHRDVERRQVLAQVGEIGLTCFL